MTRSAPTGTFFTVGVVRSLLWPGQTLAARVTMSSATWRSDWAKAAAGIRQRPSNTRVDVRVIAGSCDGCQANLAMPAHRVAKNA
ncbi:hypothetical protein G6F22_021971 [Rhizopus arrhizus]|nr:hypothetical protein G6F22_021971 [Rhizopus arrhizus]